MYVDASSNQLYEQLHIGNITPLHHFLLECILTSSASQAYFDLALILHCNSFISNSVISWSCSNMTRECTTLLTCYLKVDRFFWLKVPAMCQSLMSVYVPGHQLFQVFAICWNLNLPLVDLQVVSNHKTNYSTA